MEQQKGQPKKAEQSEMIVGIIRGTHGLAGTCKVESTSGECDHFFELTDVTLRKGSITKQIEIESVEGCASSLLITFKGIDSIDEASKYRGFEIIVPKDKACPLFKDEYYVEDLKSCSLVYYENGKKTGKKELAENSAPITAGYITDVLEGGAGDLLEVSLTESVDILLNSTDKDGNRISSKDRKVLVPFRKEFIGTVDLKSKTVQLMHLWILE
ncbi:MAG TPA: ribosome maturation factor RimM [Treponemataceae bacterium]|nr:ribosome maturation factor RimM [Treponemataceae bacterium]